MTEQATSQAIRKEIIRAEKVIPGGVSSPLRACRNVNSQALVIDKAIGECLYDVNGRIYHDFMYGFGPMILGHNHPAIVNAITERIQTGSLFGTVTPDETLLAEMITGTAPFLEQIRFVCSGTEAVMSAIRLARAYTGKTKIIRFRGGYHGHFDLVQSKSEKDYKSAGLDPEAMKANIMAVFNDLDSVRSAVAAFEGEIAAIVLEPLPCNMSLVDPAITFLKGLREICDETGILLIFDEVISGFRLTYGPVSNLLGVEPDLVTFGKIIGGGTPVGAFGGRKDIMHLLDEEQILQGGTFAGNPLTMRAGIATLTVLNEPGFYEMLDKKGGYLEEQIALNQKKFGTDFIFARRGSIFAFIFHPNGTLIANHEDVHRQARQIFTGLYVDMRNQGYHLCPDVEETMYVSAATQETTLSAFAEAACKSIAHWHCVS